MHPGALFAENLFGAAPDSLKPAEAAQVLGSSFTAVIGAATAAPSTASGAAFGSILALPGSSVSPVQAVARLGDVKLLYAAAVAQATGRSISSVASPGRGEVSTAGYAIGARVALVGQGSAMVFSATKPSRRVVPGVTDMRIKIRRLGARPLQS